MMLFSDTYICDLSFIPTAWIKREAGGGGVGQVGMVFKETLGCLQ